MQTSPGLSKSFWAIALWACLPVASSAQTASPNHSVHHRNESVKSSASPSPTASPGAMGMMEDHQDMQRMMEPRGSPPKELYSSLMDLPNVSAERRAEIESLAHERMETSRALMSKALEKISAASAREDYRAMEEGSAQLRAALAQYESGLAAQRALTEGKSPRNVALEWFKREMNLLPSPMENTPHGFFGLSWFHYVVMSMLAVFIVAMISMYFHKMRRAEALMAQLAQRAPTRSSKTVTTVSAHESPLPERNKALPEQTEGA